MINKTIETIKNKKIAILGFGREGQSTYNFIRKYLPDIEFTIIDIRNVCDNDIFSPEDKINFVYGETYLDNLEQYDLVIKSPGISLKNIDTSRINITSQIELVLSVARDRVIGITGTKGKTTTSLLLHSILIANGVDAIFAGNMGIPIFSILEDIKDNTFIVVEMSSHQLEYLNTSPHIGVILNLFEDHLDHAGSIQHYHEIKMHMFSNQTINDYMIYCQDNKTLKNLIKKNHFKGIEYTVDMFNQNATLYIKNNEVYYNDKFVFNSNIKTNLRGIHNLENIMVAFVISKILNLDDKKTLKAIEKFKPVAYRLELIGVVNDVEYYVDTLATIPQATENAIKSINNINTLIFGGLDRGISYEGFAKFLTKTDIEHFICMPTTGHIIARDLPKDRVYLVDNLEEACKLSKKLTKKNMSCVLSPAASSYNQFKNYADKGDRFKEYILNKENN